MNETHPSLGETYETAFAESPERLHWTMQRCMPWARQLAHISTKNIAGRTR